MGAGFSIYRDLAALAGLYRLFTLAGILVYQNKVKARVQCTRAFIIL